MRLKLDRLRELGIDAVETGAPDAGTIEAKESSLRFQRMDLVEAERVRSLFAEEQFELPFEEVAPDAAREEAEWRRRLEEEYLRYHAEFRGLHRRIPAAGWRAEYVEEIHSLGYETVLGD